MRTRIFTIFTVYAPIFVQLTAAFHFFYLQERGERRGGGGRGGGGREGERITSRWPSGKVRYLALDLLKIFFWKETTVKEILNVRL